MIKPSETVLGKYAFVGTNVGTQRRSPAPSDSVLRLGDLPWLAPRQRKATGSANSELCKQRLFTQVAKGKYACDLAASHALDSAHALRSFKQIWREAAKLRTASTKEKQRACACARFSCFPAADLQLRCLVHTTRCQGYEMVQPHCHTLLVRLEHPSDCKSPQTRSGCYGFFFSLCFAPTLKPTVIWRWLWRGLAWPSELGMWEKCRGPGSCCVRHWRFVVGEP